MRKSIPLASLVSMLLISGSAFAGSNYVNLDQSGDAQNASIDQTQGSNNSVGNGNQAVSQNNGGYSGQNSLTVVQSGSSNTFGVYGASYQSGSYNQNTVVQQGSQSNVEAVQNGFANGYDFGSGGSFIVQGTTAFQSDVNATSTGNRNRFQVYQGGTGNSATLNQNGSDNLLSINQGYSVGGYYNRINATQYGNGNTGSILQGSDSNTVSLTQYNNNNNAQISQVSASNTATVVQNGFTNAATVRQ